ncbi:hypothetical protein CDAR_206621 [Caerostris darwini]|uniref:Uncharacterized protein n=1 Tax=Caerostris darwini TaxID=1538125 RepID=A0AAV4SA53_9ARAC|nr:hypothetical protein CDAR_206621 [Caerostris darwini]
MWTSFNLSVTMEWSTLNNSTRYHHGGVKHLIIVLDTTMECSSFHNEGVTIVWPSFNRFNSIQKLSHYTDSAFVTKISGDTMVWISLNNGYYYNQSEATISHHGIFEQWCFVHPLRGPHSTIVPGVTMMWKSLNKGP